MDLSGLLWGVYCPPCQSLSHLTAHRVAAFLLLWANLLSEEESEDDLLDRFDDDGQFPAGGLINGSKNG